MKEISDIVKAYDSARAQGLSCALATVVKVEGSSYRQPGARMLVTQDGMLTGAISGGCLEGDALKRALLAIHQQQNKLITYDTSNESDLEFGIQLGCNGIVHILFEYIDYSDEANPVQLLKQLRTVRSDAIVTTLFASGRTGTHPGTILYYKSETEWKGTMGETLVPEIQQVLTGKVTVVKEVIYEGISLEALLDYVPAPPSLIIAGAGNDVKPLAAMAAILGWEVTVADGRATHATPKRFPGVDRIILAKPEEVIEELAIDARTYVVLMTHNYHYDLAMLKQLVQTNCPYIGALGPQTKLHRMLDELHREGITVTREQMLRVYGPVGLDIGAETSEEIAVSIIAEIKAVMSGRSGNPLKYKPGRIHTAIA